MSARISRFAACCFVLAVLFACGGGGAETVTTSAGEASAPEAASRRGKGPSAKRVGPTDVSPAKVGKLKFEAIHWGKERGFGQNGGYISAVDADSGKELWTLKVYDVQYDPKMESDVQDIFIKTISKSLFGGKLNVTDERGREYVVDPATRSVQRR